MLVLLAAFWDVLLETLREVGENYREEKERKRLENIDFDQIQCVTLDFTEPAYRTETVEEFDVVATDFLTRRDGWQHYETETVEQVVEDGINYCFTITYKDGTQIYRKFHEYSPITWKLMAFTNKAPGTVVIKYADGTKKVLEFKDDDL